MEIINSFTGSFVGRTGSCRSAQRRYRDSDMSTLRISRCEGWLHPHLSPRPWWTRSLYPSRCLYCTLQRGTLMGRLHSIWESVGQGVVRWLTHPHWPGKKYLYSLPTLCGMLCLQPFFKKLNLGIYSYACHELQQNGENQLRGTTFRTQLKWQRTEQLLGHCYQNIDNKTLFCLRETLLSVRKSSSCILSTATQGLDTGKLHFLKTPALTRGI